MSINSNDDKNKHREDSNEISSKKEEENKDNSNIFNTNLEEINDTQPFFKIKTRQFKIFFQSNEIYNKETILNQEDILLQNCKDKFQKQWDAYCEKYINEEENLAFKEEITNKYDFYEEQVLSNNKDSTKKDNDLEANNVDNNVYAFDEFNVNFKKDVNVENLVCSKDDNQNMIKDSNFMHENVYREKFKMENKSMESRSSIYTENAYSLENYGTNSIKTDIENLDSSSNTGNFIDLRLELNDSKLKFIKCDDNDKKNFKFVIKRKDVNNPEEFDGSVLNTNHLKFNNLYDKNRNSYTNSISSGFDPSTESINNDFLNKQKDDKSKTEKNTTSQKRKHVKKTAKNQISHVIFEQSISKLFPDLRNETFEYVTKYAKVEQQISKKQFITQKERLISALIDESETSQIENSEKFLKITVKSDEVEIKQNNREVDKFFKKNQINTHQKSETDSKIQKKIIEQNRINNERKMQLSNILKNRIAQKAFLDALLKIDQAIIKLYQKRIKNKKRYKLTDYPVEIDEMLQKRKDFTEKYKEFSNGDLLKIEGIFLKDNVNTKDLNYEPKNYFNN